MSEDGYDENLIIVQSCIELSSNNLIVPSYYFPDRYLIYLFSVKDIFACES